MPLEEHVTGVLIVSASQTVSDALLALLPEPDYTPVCTVRSAAEARRQLQLRSYDLVFVNTPLPDEFGSKLAADLCTDHSSAVTLLVRSELYDELCARVSPFGVFTLRKPTSNAMLLQALDWMRASCERLRRLEKKAVSLEEKMAEIRLVNHAKWALIEALKMTETDAHKYIEKQAMDRCMTRREIAESILRTYP